MATRKLLIGITIFGLLFASGGSLQAQRSIHAADDRFDAFDFEAAAAMYINALQSRRGVHDEVHVTARIGDCYRLMNVPEVAKTWYERAVRTGAGAETLLHYAHMLRACADYGEAADAFSQYAALRPGAPGIHGIIEGLQRIEELSVPSSAYTLEIMPVNSDGSDFGPFVYGGKFYFTTNGHPAGSKGTSIKQDVWTGRDYLQLYEADLEGSDAIANVQRIRSRANGPYHDGPVSIDPQNGDMYITRNHYDKKQQGGQPIVHLKVVRRKATGANTWSDEITEDFTYNRDGHSVGHIAFSADGSTVYFASDMDHEAALGGVDLYRAFRRGDEWSGLEHLGPEINSAGDDMFPYVSADGTLYFASNGREGLGGLDIYEARTDKDTWKVFNMGAPLNTNYDDFSLVLQPESCQGFFTSNRPADFGDDNIYAFCDNGVTVIGRVVDAETGLPVENAAVELKAEGEGARSMHTIDGGLFRFHVPVDADHSLSVCAEGYLCRMEQEVAVSGASPGDVVEVEIPLEPVEPVELMVRVVSRRTGQPIPFASLAFEDRCTDETIHLMADGSGSSLLSLEEKCDYGISAMAGGYLPGDVEFKPAGTGITEELVIELAMDGVLNIADMKDGLVVHHVYYGYDKSDPVVQSEEDLQVILDFMTNNPEVVVQIEAHADSRASRRYNQTLSLKRAKAVRDWLVDGGIAADRLKVEAFGESRPVNTCSDNVPCSEREHQMNRRTEFRLVAGQVETRSLQRFDVAVDPCTYCAPEEELSVMP